MSFNGVFLPFSDDFLAPIASNDVNIFPELGQITPSAHLPLDPNEAVIQARGRRVIPRSFSPEGNRSSQQVISQISVISLYHDLIPLLFSAVACREEESREDQAVLYKQQNNV